MSGIPSWAVRGAKVVCVSIRPAESYPEAIITVDEIDSRDREGYDAAERALRSFANAIRKGGA